MSHTIDPVGPARRQAAPASAHPSAHPSDSPPDTRPRPAGRPRRQGSGLFRAFWRWHFYASFLVAPILVVMATTGLIYLFRFELEPMLHEDLMRVTQPVGTDITQPYSVQYDAVRAAYPQAEVVSMTEPTDGEESTRFSITTATGEPRDVFVDPWAGEVLGSLNPDKTLSGYAVLIHGELMAGRLGDAVIELAACWALVMALTGYFLFVRGWRARRNRLRRGVPGARLRSRHAMVGSVVGIGLLYLLVSGLPWTGVWGEQVQKLAAANGSSLWSQDHGAVSDPTSTLDESLPHSHTGDPVPWAQEDSAVPRSQRPNGHAGATGEANVANIDTAVAVADRQGLRHPMTVALPGGGDGVFSVIGYAFDAPSDERTVHVDRYGGQVVSTYGFDDYPVLAKVVAQGIGLHEGRSLGLWSFWGAAAMCLAILFSCITGPLMWWRRRPRGTSPGAPRGRLPLLSSPFLAVALVALGLLLPVFGISLLAVLLLDQLLIRRVPALRGYFGSA